MRRMIGALGALLLATSTAACAGGSAPAPTDGVASHQGAHDGTSGEASPPPASDPGAGASDCDPEWLARMSHDGAFPVAVRGDLVGSQTLPGVGDAGPVTFTVPSRCVVDVDLGSLGISRSYFFGDGVPMTLAESFEAAGWHGDFGYSGGYPDGAFAPAAYSAADPSLAYANISAGLVEASNMDLPANWYILQLTPTLVDLIGG